MLGVNMCQFVLMKHGIGNTHKPLYQTYEEQDMQCLHEYPYADHTPPHCPPLIFDPLYDRGCTFPLFCF